MTPEERADVLIEEMFAGVSSPGDWWPFLQKLYSPKIATAIRAAVEQEREACAALAKQVVVPMIRAVDPTQLDLELNGLACRIAVAIRARGSK